MRGRKRRFIGWLSLAALLWLLGLIAFATDAALLDDVPTAPAEAIIVVTGGSDRIEQGLQLLQSGYASQLLISGVGATPEDLAKRYGIAQRWLDCCITLGTTATDTLSNATEAADYVQQRQYKSVAVVTAHYHLRRTLWEFRTQMPQIKLIGVAVAPKHVRITDWWQQPGTARLLVGEYNKLIAAFVRGLL